jgi:pyrroloquinoline-quinone synthase
MNTMQEEKTALSVEAFEQAILNKGQYYHIYHPFHIMMHEGQASQEQIQAWVANRFYYQINIPLKDAAIMANCPDQRVRQEWIQRMIDQDGIYPDGGGREAWLSLAEAVGLTREQVISEELVLPGVRFAVDAYVNFARRSSWREAASSSLTELFAPQIHQSRLESWPKHYPWIQEQGYTYFRSRLSQARRDVEHGLTITLDSFKTIEQQERMLEILQFKLDILWTILDALSLAYVHNQAPYQSVTSDNVWHKGLFK